MDAADLRRIRVNILKLTQAQLARELGMSSRGYEAIENSRASLRRTHLLALLGVCILHGHGAETSLVRSIL